MAAYLRSSHGAQLSEGLADELIKHSPQEATSFGRDSTPKREDLHGVCLDLRSRDSLSTGAEQLHKFHIKGGRDFPEAGQRECGTAVLSALDRLRVHAGSLGQSLLREISIPADPSQTRTNVSQELLVVLIHRTYSLGLAKLWRHVGEHRVRSPM